MKTTIAISAVLLAALSACAEQPPPRQPTMTSGAATTTTTSYPTYQQHATHAQHDSSSSTQDTPGAISTMGTASSDGTYATNNSGTIHKSTIAPPSEPALNEPEASARPVAPQPGPANAKSADGKSPTAAAAADQNNGKSEVQIAAAIRRRLVASNSLSFGAKNVKVITQGTKVTLRGNVKTEAEKNEIEGTARNTDGVTEVENQLVVKK